MRLLIRPPGRHPSPASEEAAHRLGEELYDLCKSEENKFAEFKALFESLTEDQIPEVVFGMHDVSES